MFRRCLTLSAAAGAVAVASLVVAVGASLAGDDDAKEKSALAKMMIKIDKDTKLVREGTKSLTKFKKANSGKDVAKAAGEIAKYAKEFRDMKEPSEKMKKPFSKWTDLTDRYETAARDMEKAAAKGDFAASQKAWNPLYVSCSNCHGAFRPEVGDGF
ncbi:MAG: cytochrome c [Isosphaeraceae bacterium]|nr:cytochrome c [Isosphaeraceae bacterium]